MADDEPLDPEVEALVLSELRTDQCISGWTVLPNDDLLVFLIDRDLERSCAPFIAAAGRPRPGSGPTLVFAREEGRWARVGAGSWGLGPDKLIRLFEIADRMRPRPEWAVGARLCRQWFRWSVQPPTQEGVDELLGAIDAEPAPCPIWREMRRQFVRWAGVRGFVAREAARAESGAAADGAGK